ncbi:MAG: hypothetical protein FWE82_02385 [Defluviitaleaceae bacterium]|nr:hypothetical protein [Defluviitaleaceae bacterium]
MMYGKNNFEPDYKNILSAASNKKSKRLPLYEHTISDGTMEKITGKNFSGLLSGSKADKKEYFSNAWEFYRHMGYDCMSFECCITSVLPHGGCLGSHRESVIHSYDDFLRYPWDEVSDIYFNAFADIFDALRDTMPPGMKAVGGVGNGVFECVQDLLGYMNMCFIKSDMPELYEGIFKKTGEMILSIWQKFLPLYGDIYCVLRAGDDLGFKSSTLISAEDIKNLVVPAYKKIIESVHAQGKPFLLHSCGNIFDVMLDMINIARIDAKHSNEDQIAPFTEWVKRYGNRIGNFGGMDTDAVCRLSYDDIRAYVKDVLDECMALGGSGIAFSSGNSIPDYVPADKYIEMVSAVRRYRGEQI